MKKLILLLLLFLALTDIHAQKIQTKNYNTTGYIKNDGTIQSSNYNTIGYFKSDGKIQNKNYKTIGYIIRKVF